MAACALTAFLAAARATLPEFIPTQRKTHGHHRHRTITPLVALIAGILILIMPRLLNFIVAIYLIFVGLMGLNAIHHFVNLH